MIHTEAGNTYDCFGSPLSFAASDLELPSLTVMRRPALGLSDLIVASFDGRNSPGRKEGVAKVLKTRRHRFCSQLRDSRSDTLFHFTTTFVSRRLNNGNFVLFLFYPAKLEYSPKLVQFAPAMAVQSSSKAAPIRVAKTYTKATQNLDIGAQTAPKSGTERSPLTASSGSRTGRLP